MATDDEYKVDKECSDATNNNVKIVENIKYDGTKEYSYKINAYIL
jgi:hypothetical protein